MKGSKFRYYNDLNYFTRNGFAIYKNIVDWLTSLFHTLMDSLDAEYDPSPIYSKSFHRTSIVTYAIGLITIMIVIIMFVYGVIPEYELIMLVLISAPMIFLASGHVYVIPLFVIFAPLFIFALLIITLILLMLIVPIYVFATITYIIDIIGTAVVKISTSPYWLITNIFDKKIIEAIAVMKNNGHTATIISITNKTNYSEKRVRNRLWYLRKMRKVTWNAGSSPYG